MVYPRTEKEEKLKFQKRKLQALIEKIVFVAQLVEHSPPILEAWVSNPVIGNIFKMNI